MKTIRLTAQQRHEIKERRRQAQDRRIYQRLSAVLWIDAGRTREEVAELSGVSKRQVGQWLRIFRNTGLDALGTLHYRGDPGRLRPAQVERLKREIAKGGFHNADQVRAWIEEHFGVAYSPSGVKDLLRRIGASDRKVSGFFWRADRDEQRAFVRKYRRHRRPGGPGAVPPKVPGASARGGPGAPPLLRGRLPPGLGPGTALLLLVAGRAAALR